mgnify:CR=1 FL=1
MSPGTSSETAISRLFSSCSHSVHPLLVTSALFWISALSFLAALWDRNSCQKRNAPLKIIIVVINMTFTQSLLPSTKIISIVKEVAPIIKRIMVNGFMNAFTSWTHHKGGFVCATIFLPYLAVRRATSFIDKPD